MAIRGSVIPQLPRVKEAGGQWSTEIKKEKGPYSTICENISTLMNSVKAYCNFMWIIWIMWASSARGNLQPDVACLCVGYDSPNVSWATAIVIFEGIYSYLFVVPAPEAPHVFPLHSATGLICSDSAAKVDDTSYHDRRVFRWRGNRSAVR